MAKPSKVKQLTKEELELIIKSSNSFAECCRKIGYCDKGRHGSDAIKSRCLELGIDTSHFNRSGSSNTKKYELDEILVKDSTYNNIARLKIRLVSENRLKYECALCGNTGIWNNKPLVLQLDHINGQHLDHRIDNLRFLCPNCHSQTETFSGKNQTTTS